MLTPDEQRFYTRQTTLAGFGIQAQEKLKEARVLVSGAGGLGVPVLQYLAGAGVGTLGIADGDTVHISNLHRQVLYSTPDTGKPKTETAQQRLQALNPHIGIHIHPAITPHNAASLIDQYDLVVDGTDNFEARYLINDTCVELGKPWVAGAVSQWEGQLSAYNWQGGPCYRDLFPTPPAPLEIPNCMENGVLGVLPGIIGTLMAGEVIKMLTGIGEPLRGRLLCYDLRQGGFQTFTFGG